MADCLDSTQALALCNHNFADYDIIQYFHISQAVWELISDIEVVVIPKLSSFQFQLHRLWDAGSYTDCEMQMHPWIMLDVC
jgi:hypothetical protein